MPSSRLGRNNAYTCSLGGKDLGIQQGTSVWVGLPKSLEVAPTIIHNYGHAYFSSLNHPQESAMVTSSKPLLKVTNHMRQ